MGKFNDDSTIGRVGEEKVYDFLNQLHTTDSIIDVSGDPWFYQFDIDLLVQRTDGAIDKYEIKTDQIAHRSGNMVYETTSNKYMGTLGCFEKTCADYLCYYISETEYLLVFDITQLRDWVADNKDNLKFVDMGDQAEGYLIPIKDMKEIALFKGKI